MFNLKWCAFTGAIMLAFVGITYVQGEKSQDRPGISTRWWDGTKKSHETRYPDGKLRSQTHYSDDGRTVILDKEWDWEGNLISQKIRLEDGRMEEKLWYRGGKTLQLHTLWLGDENYYQFKRAYFRNGVLQSEDIRTEDGQTSVLKRIFNEAGVILDKVEILSNADQVTTKYTHGKKNYERVLRGTGDVIESDFWDDEVIKDRVSEIKLDGSTISDKFDRKGVLLSTSTIYADSDDIVVVLYPTGRVKFKQKFKGTRLWQVEEFKDNKDESPSRILILNGTGAVQSIQILRQDSSVSDPIDALHISPGAGTTVLKQGGRQ